MTFDRTTADLDEPLDEGLDADWLAEDHLPTDPGRDPAELREFVLERWKERAAERGLPEPADLANACKFSALFVKSVLGGRIVGNWDHAFNEVDGKVVDICAAENAHLADPYRRDGAFMRDDAAIESFESCLPRVADWVRLFPAPTPSGPR
jgi:hypothetical protein